MLESKGLFPELEQVVSSHVDSGENSQRMTLLKSQKAEVEQKLHTSHFYIKSQFLYCWQS